MQLSQPFIRLPLTVDVDRLAVEIAQLGDDAWRRHPQGHAGNTALPLVSLRGNPADDGVAGPMRPTPALARCPYVQQVLAALQAPLGRTRLMRLDPGAEATPHVDTNYYWLQRVRVHIPVVTTPDVRFLCGDAETHMAAGEVWIFDTWRPHNVLNPARRDRIHLVADTVGSDTFWTMVGQASDPPRLIRHDPTGVAPPAFEAVNFPVVMTPWELEAILARWFDDARAGPAARNVPPLFREIEGVTGLWRALWARYADSREGWHDYVAAIARLRACAQRHSGSVPLPNGLDFGALIESSLIPALHAPALSATPAVAPEPGRPAAPSNAPAAAATRAFTGAPQRAPGNAGIPPTDATIFDRPLFIVCAPRSGSSLLFEQLAACSPDWVTVGNESHLQIESIAALRPAARDYASNRLGAGDATPVVMSELRQRFRAALRDRDGRSPAATSREFRLLEKTPKNALRIPFLESVFPGARFVYLWREPAESLASLIEGWQSGRFVTYNDLPGWRGLPWSYLLVPGWRPLAGRPLEEIVAAQWRQTHEQLLADLATVPKQRIHALTYDDLLADPERELRAICTFAGVTFDRPPPRVMPPSAHTMSPPAPGKWRRLEAQIAPQLPELEPLVRRAGEFVASHRWTTQPVPESPMANAESSPAAATTAGPTSGDAPDAIPLPVDDAQAFASVHTSNLPELLRELRASIAISTYQAGKLILARPDGTTLNTDFSTLRKPMGIAADGQRIVVGVETGVREYRNVPDVSKRLAPPGRHDAVFVFRNHHVTGDIDIHEIALAGGECWYVNTLFSCLCTLDLDHSFVPRWRPRFVTALAPEDRCHLNGLALVDGKPRYLTALGTTDTPQGWRANKKSGGVLLDYETRDTILGGLSMPHSPRWHNGRLWMLESGRGSLVTVDLAAGKVDTIARVPGFTRGLDFAGPLAFIGLSQLRETNAFTDIPITEDNRERMSGVWVVNIDTGATVAFLKFSHAVQEIFAVALLRAATFPALIEDGDEILKSTYVLPEAALREVRFSVAAG